MSFDVKVEIPASRLRPDARSGSVTASCPDSIQRRVQTTGHGASGPAKASEHPFLPAASNEGRLKPIVSPATPSRGSNKVKQFRATSF